MFQWMLRPLSHKCRGMMTGIIRRTEVICVVIYWRLCNSNICVSQPSITRSLPPSVGVFYNYHHSTIRGSSYSTQLNELIPLVVSKHTCRFPRRAFSIYIPFNVLQIYYGRCCHIHHIIPCLSNS